MQAGAALQYPNGPVLDDVTQKTVGLTASLPLFEGGQAAKDAAAQRRLAAAAELRRRQAEEELARERDKARAGLASLRAQQELDDQAAGDAAELSDLVYLSYKGGRANYLEVQSANLRHLEAKVQAARTRAQTLIQLATLAQLAAGGGR
ncbi:hypothetical protein EPO15_16360 [bacterium]|nr:MAG: hypothetical protein EPO15_16360 [bacterium]